MIIVEGVDKAGKSTMCKYLAKVFGIPVITLPRPSEFGLDFKDEFREGLNSAKICSEFALSGHRFILDRAYPSELVYASVSGRKVRREEYLNIDRNLCDVAKIFYVEPAREVLISRWQQAGYNPKFLDLLIMAYYELFSIISIPVFYAKLDSDIFSLINFNIWRNLHETSL